MSDAKSLQELLQQKPEIQQVVLKPTRSKADFEAEWIPKIMAAGEKIQKGFDLIGGVKSTYLLVAAYLCGSDNETLPQGKGIALTGKIGSGKTLLFGVMKVLSKENYPKMAEFGIMNCRYIYRDYLASHPPTAILDKYGRQSYMDTEMKRPLTWCFDDLGAEELSTNVYGNKLNVMAEILTDRYDEFKRHGMITHITTNLTGAEIRQMYGARLHDRFKEMFTFMPIEGESLRK